MSRSLSEQIEALQGLNLAIRHQLESAEAYVPGINDAVERLTASVGQTSIISANQVAFRHDYATIYPELGKRTVMNSMDIKTLSQRTGIPVRRLRYVLDNDLISPMAWNIEDCEIEWGADENAVGRPRTFNEITAVYMASAAYLLDAGCKRDSVRDMLEAIGRFAPPAKRQFRMPAVATALTGTTAAYVEIGDGRFVRWRLGNKTYDWIDAVPPLTDAKEASPKVIIGLDIGQIRDRVKNIEGSD
jgi:hypothetical protein